MASRRIRGEGSVYQRKSGDGRWVGSFKVEETGKRKYVYGSTQKEALDKLKAAQREQEQGTLAIGKDQTLKDYLTYWLEKVHKPTIRVTTYARYCVYVDKHLIPSLGQVRLRKLTTRHVQTFVAGKIESGLAPRTVRGIYGLLHGALDYALRSKLVSQNVCNEVTLPKAHKRKKQLLTKEQIQKLIEVANTHEMGPFIKLGLMSGMRHGEMLALRWADIDFERSTLSVVRNVARIAGQGFVVGEPKTESGARVILLPPFVVKALKVQRERQQVQRELAGVKWKERDLVFCTREGEFVRKEVSLARFRKVLVLAGLPPQMRVHDLRHNVATFLINVLHYPPTLVQALLGHSDVAITMREYAGEIDLEMLRPMMDDLNKLFGGE